MPLTIPVGDALVAYHFRFGGDLEDMIITIGGRAVAGPFSLLHTERFGQAWRVNMLPFQSSGGVLAKVVARVRQDGGGDIVHEWVPSPVAGGGSAGTTFPPNVALLVRKHTNRGGRRGRGRWFVPGIVETLADNDGSVPSASIASWNTALDAYRTDLGGALLSGSPVEPLLFHNNSTTTTTTTGPGSKTITITEGAAGPAPDVITDFTVDTKVATQRRRLRA